MKMKQHDGLSVAVFDFEQMNSVKHGISTRIGGVSEGVWASLNLGFHRGDNPEHVRENFRRFTAAVGVCEGHTVFSAQTHDTKIRRVTQADRGKGLGVSDIKNIDALMTNETAVALVTFFADCVPIFFFDPVRKAIAAAHAGWRGTVARIGQKTVQALQEAYDCRPADILAGIGPSIGPCCFLTDAPVAEEFLKRIPECEPFVVKQGHKYAIDLWNCNKRLLLGAGLEEENIDCSPICTCCHPELFYSHRRDGERRGSMAGVIVLSGD